MLTDRRVLIAEDEPFIALDLARSVEAAHGEVVGPFATVKEGMVYLAQNDAHAAILDVQLADRDVSPLAIELLNRGRAVVFHTSQAIPDEVVKRHGMLPMCRKPMPAEHVVFHLARALSKIA